MKDKTKQSSGSLRDKHKHTRKYNKWKNPFFVQAVKWGTRKRRRSRK